MCSTGGTGQDGYSGKANYINACCTGHYHCPGHQARHP